MKTWEKLVTIGIVIVLAGIATTYNKQQELWITLTQAAVGIIGLGWLVYASKYLKKQVLEEKKMFEKKETGEIVSSRVFDFGSNEDFLVGAQERVRELKEHLDNETKVFESRYQEINELKNVLLAQGNIMKKVWLQLEREETVVKGILRIRQARQ